MSPGSYLRKRREVAGFTVAQIAVALAAMQDRVRAIQPSDFGRLERHLVAVEGNGVALAPMQAALLRRVFDFDLGVYEHLLVRQFGEMPADLPEPQICAGCGAGWLDTCGCDDAPDAPLALDPCTSTVRRAEESSHEI